MAFLFDHHVRKVVHLGKKNYDLKLFFVFSDAGVSLIIESLESCVWDYGTLMLFLNDRLKVSIDIVF